jgi:hypothetical protein
LIWLLELCHCFQLSPLRLSVKVRFFRTLTGRLSCDKNDSDYNMGWWGEGREDIPVNTNVLQISASSLQHWWGELEAALRLDNFVSVNMPGQNSHNSLNLSRFQHKLHNNFMNACSSNGAYKINGYSVLSNYRAKEPWWIWFPPLIQDLC